MGLRSVDAWSELCWICGIDQKRLLRAFQEIHRGALSRAIAPRQVMLDPPCALALGVGSQQISGILPPGVLLHESSAKRSSRITGIIFYLGNEPWNQAVILVTPEGGPLHE